MKKSNREKNKSSDEYIEAPEGKLCLGIFDLLKEECEPRGQEGLKIALHTLEIVLASLLKMTGRKDLEAGVDHFANDVKNILSKDSQ